MNEAGNMKIYLSGNLTGNPTYKTDFERVAIKLEAEGHIVLKPAELPEGMRQEDYMRICFSTAFTRAQTELNTMHGALAKIEDGELAAKLRTAALAVQEKWMPMFKETEA